MTALAVTTAGERSAAPGPLGISTALDRLIAAGESPSGRRQRRSVVTAFTRTFTDLGGWDTAPLSRRLATPITVRGLVAFLLMATAHRAQARYVCSCRSEWGRHAATVYPTFAGTFHHTVLPLDTALGVEH